MIESIVKVGELVMSFGKQALQEYVRREIVLFLLATGYKGNCTITAKGERFLRLKSVEYKDHSERSVRFYIVNPDPRFGTYLIGVGLNSDEGESLSKAIKNLEDVEPGVWRKRGEHREKLEKAKETQAELLEKDEEEEDDDPLGFRELDAQKFKLPPSPIDAPVRLAGPVIFSGPTITASKKVTRPAKLPTSPVVAVEKPAESPTPQPLSVVTAEVAEESAEPPPRARSDSEDLRAEVVKRRAAKKRRQRLRAKERKREKITHDIERRRARREPESATSRLSKTATEILFILVGATKRDPVITGNELLSLLAQIPQEIRGQFGDGVRELERFGVLKRGIGQRIHVLPDASVLAQQLAQEAKK